METNPFRRISHHLCLPYPQVHYPPPLQEMGTLFKEFRFDQGPTGHFNGHTTAITGQHTNNTLSLRDHPENPTIFELYRKHSSPVGNALNSWWISHTNNLYPILNYSQHPSYGPAYAANQIAPAQLYSYQTGTELEYDLNLSPHKEELVGDVRDFLNFNFGINDNSLNHVANTPQEVERIEAWMAKMIAQMKSGGHSNPWNIPGGMNGDMRNIFYAEEVLREFQPELTVVNMFSVDVAHTNFTNYCNALQYADWAIAHLWSTIQSTPGMANDTIMIVAPEIGRNSVPNSIVDGNGRFALDHTTDDPLSRELFCMVVGPPSVVEQNKVISQIEGKSIDIVPTIADILGIGNDVQGILPGTTLNSAFI